MVEIAAIPQELGNLQRNRDDTPKTHGATDGDLQLENGDGVVLCVPPAAGSTTITLPGVAASHGLKFLIESVGNDTGDIVVESKGDEIAAFSDVTLTADEDFLYVENIAGRRWHTIDSLAT